MKLLAKNDFVILFYQLQELVQIYAHILANKICFPVRMDI